jgi:hypothetical protein
VFTTISDRFAVSTLGLSLAINVRGKDPDSQIRLFLPGVALRIVCERGEAVGGDESAPVQLRRIEGAC